MVWLAGSEPGREGLVAAAARAPAIREEGAELLVILQAPLAEAERLRDEAGLSGPVLVDADGRVHAQAGARPSALLVANLSGTVYWRTVPAETESDFGEAYSWLEYINILEPECGTCVPAWPSEVMDA